MMHRITDFRILFQSTPPARGATVTNNGISTTSKISIHAPREGGDGKNQQLLL